MGRGQIEGKPMAVTMRSSGTDDPADAATQGKYHFLDVGAQKYGDCILVEFGALRVLIDGSHEKDFEGQTGYDSTPEQLQAIFGDEPAPHPITLMVVTHCHQDHVGALPKLVSEGVIDPEWALVTDHKLGFGRSEDDTDSVDLADARTRTLAAALREEDASDLSDDELQQFMDGAATVESKYLAMLEDLKARGVKVIEYRGQKLPQALLTKMKPTGMSLLGPSRDLLVFAAEQIATTNKDASDAVKAALGADAGLSDVELYRSIVEATADAGGGNARGNGMNCQSITLAFGPKHARVLLAGDMQFTEPGVKGADDEIAKLRAKVEAAGPYRLFKTTHHTSHNGQDDDLLRELGDPPIIVHTGGRNDPSHPYPTTLQLLKRRRRDIVFARTDRNGQITVEPHRDPSDAVWISRGRVNDFTDNVLDEPQAAEPSAAVATATIAPMSSTGSQATAPQVIIVNLPPGPVDMTVSGVDIVVRDPAKGPERAGGAPARDEPRTATRRRSATASTSAISLAGGRVLPKLAFVTDSERLGQNIGEHEARAALDSVRASRHAFVDIAGRRPSAFEEVRTKLRADDTIAGVVILGGYDVVESMVVDVLPPALRKILGPELTQKDGDNFLVWSDERFGDIDGDRIAERPVSRIPDARDSALFLTALQAGISAPADRYGIRNVARPFATAIWNELPGRRALNVSKAYVSSQVTAADTREGSQYFMLHGSDTDATVFSGEDGVSYTRAFSVANVPPVFDGVVFTGCCWGALTVSQKAAEIGNAQPAPRVAERSIALSYLKAGANAFVGCTGAHYSGPDPDEDVNYALPLHAAFWKTLPKVGHSASLALFGARKYYGDLIGSGHVEREPLDLARRLKNRAQFTCLGLGW